MRTDQTRRSLPSTVQLRLGRWLEVRGAGWGVAVVPLLVLAIVALAALRLTG